MVALQVGFPSISYGFGAGTLKGFIKNEAEEPVAGATVTLHDLYDSYTVTADSYGYYEFTNLYEMSPVMQVVAPGYRAVGMTDFWIDGAGTTEIDLELTAYSTAAPGAWKAGSQTSQHLALLAGDGTVWTTGENTIGQLGDGTTNSRDRLMQVPGLNGIVQWRPAKILRWR